MSWTQNILMLAIVVAGLVFLQLCLGRQIERRNDIWNHIHTVGVRHRGSRIDWALALVNSVTSMQETMREGYEKFSKMGKPFALPTMWIGGPLIVLPPSMLYLLNKPREELSSFDALLENAQFQYLMTDKDVWGNTIHFDIVRKHLGPKNMESLAGIIGEEWDRAFQVCWGFSREGTVVNAWDSMVRIISHAALRIMVGLPGCRNDDYLEESRLYANAVLVDACFINCIPPIVRPIAGRLLAFRARYYQRRLLRTLLPMVDEKLREYQDPKIQNDDPVCSPSQFRPI